MVRMPLAELTDPANRLRVRHPSGYVGPASRSRDAGVGVHRRGALHPARTGWMGPTRGRADRVVSAPPPSALAGPYAKRGVGLVDLLLVALCLLFAVSGYRQGFVVGVLSFAGFFGGALLGLQFGPLLARQLTATRCGSWSRWCRVRPGGAGAGARRLDRLPAAQHHPQRPGPPASTTSAARWCRWWRWSWWPGWWRCRWPRPRMPWLNKAVRDWAVLRAVDQVMPDPARSLSQALRDTVDTRGFPDVFGNLTPTRVRDVAAAGPGAGRLPVVRRPPARWRRSTAARRAARDGSRAPGSSTPPGT